MFSEKYKKLSKLAWQFTLSKLRRDVPYIGIYSFPKSGNTWMRHIIAELYSLEFNHRQVSKDIPDMHQGPIFDARPIQLGAGGQAVRFYKSHRCEIVARNALQKINHRGIIYIKRHPLDVFLSYLNYLRDGVNGTAGLYLLPVKSVEEVIANGSLEIFLDCFILFGTLVNWGNFGNWFEHMAYWTGRDVVEQGGREVPVACLKYEDMVANGVEAMQPLCDMLGQSKQQLEQALLAANEKTRVDGKLFWKQRPGLYKEVLPESLIAKFRKYHGDRVAALGYEI